MARVMPPPSPPAQLAAQRYNEVQNHDELIGEAGVGINLEIRGVTTEAKSEMAFLGASMIYSR